MGEAQGAQGAQGVIRGRDLLTAALRIHEQARLVRHLRARGRVRIGAGVPQGEGQDLLFSEWVCSKLVAAELGRVEGGSLVYTGAPEPGPPLVLVGEDNPYSSHPFLALYDFPPQSAGGRLRAKVLGVSRETYFGPDVSRHDLCIGPWRAKEARQNAAALGHSQHPQATFVLLGTRVQEAFGFFKGAPYKCISGPAPGGGTRSVVLLPHPSGRCRAWQEPGAVDRARQAIKQAAPWFPLGEVEKGQ